MSVALIHGTTALGGSLPAAGLHGRIDGSAPLEIGDGVFEGAGLEWDATYGSATGALDIGITAATTGINIGTGGTFTGTVTIGDPAAGVTIAGDLTVSGTTISASATTVDITDNLITVNDGAGGAGYDSGVIGQRNATDYQADTDFAARRIHLDTQTGLAGTDDEVKFESGASSTDDAYNGAFVVVNHGLLASQSREITDYVGATRVATLASAWTPAAGTGTVSGTIATSAITGVGTAFTTELQVGDRITIDTGGTPEVHEVATITDDTNMTIVSTLAATKAGVTFQADAPGGNATSTTKASLTSSFFVGLFWDESANQYVAGGTLADPGAGPVVIETYLPFQAALTAYKELESDPSTISDTGQVYTKETGGETELFYYDSAGNAVQITSGGALNAAAASLQGSYDGGNVVNISTNSIEFNGDNSNDVSVLDFTPSTLVGTTAPVVNMDFPAAAYTGTPIGMEVDYGGATSVTTGSNFAAFNARGIANSGAGDSFGFWADANFDKSIAMGTLASGTINLANESTNIAAMTFEVAEGDTDLDAPNFNFLGSAGGAASATAGGDGSAWFFQAGGGGAAAAAAVAGDGGGFTVIGGVAGVGSAGNQASGSAGAVNLIGGVGGVAVTGFAATSGGASGLAGGAGGSSSVAAQPAATGGAAALIGGAGGAHTGGGTAGDGGSAVLQGGAGGDGTTDGAGGQAIVRGGAGKTDSAGGQVVIVGGAGGSTTGASGGVSIDPGSIVSGTIGSVAIGGTNTPPEISLNAGSTGLDFDSGGPIEMDASGAFSIGSNTTPSSYSANIGGAFAIDATGAYTVGATTAPSSIAMDTGGAFTIGGSTTPTNFSVDNSGSFSIGATTQPTSMTFDTSGTITIGSNGTNTGWSGTFGGNHTTGFTTAAADAAGFQYTVTGGTAGAAGGSNNPGGTVSINGGVGGAASGGNAGTLGGQVANVGGAGGASDGTSAGGAGGELALSGGVGGVGSGGAADGAGGVVNIAGGASGGLGADSAAGGDVNITGGAANGSGLGGSVDISAGGSGSGTIGGIAIGSVANSVEIGTSVASTDVTMSPGTAAARGQVVVGDSADSSLNSVVIYDGGGAGLAAELVLYDQSGNPYALWVDTSGNLRIEQAATKSGDTNGTIVGAQGG